MEISKYYITDDGMLGLGGLSYGKIGTRWANKKELHLSERVLGYVRNGPGIPHLEIILNMFADYGTLILPLNSCINPPYKKASAVIHVLNKEGYIDKKVENASNQQEDTHSRFSLLCKTANITGKFPKVFEFYETKLPVKWLKLKEALNYMSLSMAVVAPLLISPMTTRSIEDATGYKNSSIWNVFSALRYLHLLDRSGNYYSLTSRPDRRQNVLYALRRCARKRVECADVLKTVASSCDANGWTFIGFRPSLEEMSVRINNQYGKRGLKLRKQILDLFLSEGLIVYADYEKLSSISK